MTLKERVEKVEKALAKLEKNKTALRTLPSQYKGWERDIDLRSVKPGDLIRHPIDRAASGVIPSWTVVDVNDSEIVMMRRTTVQLRAKGFQKLSYTGDV